MPLVRQNWLKNGQRLRDPDTGQFAWRGRVGEVNVFDNGQYYPYLLNGNSLKHGTSEIEFGATHTIRRDGTVLATQDYQIEREVSPGIWAPLNKGVAEITSVQGDETAVVTLGYDHALYRFEIDYHVGRSNRVVMVWRFTPTEDMRMRIVWTNSGNTGTPVLLTAVESKNGTISKTIGVLYDGLQYRWAYLEADQRTIVTRQQGQNQIVDITLGPYDVLANQTLTITPDTFGPSAVPANNRDADWDGGLNGLGNQSLWVDDGDTIDWRGGGIAFTGVDLNSGGAIASIDAGTQLDMDCENDHTGSEGTVRFECEDAQDPAVFGSGSGAAKPSGRTTTSSNIDQDLSTGVSNHTFDIVAIIQDLIDNGYTYDGTSGNDVIAITFAAGEKGLTNVSWRNVTYDYNHSSLGPAELTIVYTVGAGGEPLPAFTPVEQISVRSH